jgi:hypothetical protein
VVVSDEQLRLSESGEKPAPLDISGMGVGPARVGFRVDYSERPHAGDSLRISTHFLEAPLDLDARAKGQDGWLPKTVAGKTAWFRKPGKAVVFQPNPTTIVGVTNWSWLQPDWEAVERVIRRGEDDFDIPAEQWDVLQQVSGYAEMTAFRSGPENTVARVIPKFQATGTRRTPRDGSRFPDSETYHVSVFESEARARNALAEQWALQKSFDKMMREWPGQGEGKRPEQTFYAWVKGKYLHTLHITR